MWYQHSVVALLTLMPGKCSPDTSSSSSESTYKRLIKHGKAQSLFISHTRVTYTPFWPLPSSAARQPSPHDSFFLPIQIQLCADAQNAAAACSMERTLHILPQLLRIATLLLHPLHELHLNILARSSVCGGRGLDLGTWYHLCGEQG